ncbi:MAG: hypothetical protein R3E18_05080 [Sphingomonadaceae bacterium]|nr:hypothetical protein [Sphingomonadaceae bacterium]
MRGVRTGLAALALGLCATAPLAAKSKAGEEPPLGTAVDVTDPAMLAAIAEAERRGRLLWLYDQAAWHATDAMRADIDPSKVAGAAGYVVIPRDGDAMLDVVFVAERKEALLEFARYTVDVSKVVSGGPVDGDLPALSPLAERMFKARGPAIEAMVKEKYGLCSRSPANTVTLPPDENDVISFYLLTSTVHDDVYPLGGHYRADVDADNEVVSTRRYMKSCFDIQLPGTSGKMQDGKRPVATMVTYLLGDQPSEIHSFVAHYVPMQMLIITVSNEKTWRVGKDKIEQVELKKGS